MTELQVLYIAYAGGLVAGVYALTLVLREHWS